MNHTEEGQGLSNAVPAVRLGSSLRSIQKLVAGKLSARLWIVVATALLYAITEFSSPDYSVVDKIQAIFNSNYVAPIGPSELKIPHVGDFNTSVAIKSGYFLAILFLLSILLRFSDPFRNNSELERFRRGERQPSGIGAIFLSGLASDISAYSACMPSSNLRRLCGVCADQWQCKNHIDRDDHFLGANSFAVWRGVFYGKAIPPREHQELATLVNQCKTNYYLRWVALAVSFGGILIVFSHLLIEYISQMPLRISMIAVLLVLVSLASYKLLGRLSSSRSGAYSGCWERLKGKSDEIQRAVTSGGFYERIYSAEICAFEGGNCAFRRTEAELEAQMDGHLHGIIAIADKIISSKIAKLVSGSPPTDVNSYIENIVEHLEAWYRAEVLRGRSDVEVKFVRSLAAIPIFCGLDSNDVMRKVNSEIAEVGYFSADLCGDEVGPQLIRRASGVASVLISPVGLSSEHVEAVKREIGRRLPGPRQKIPSLRDHGWLVLTSTRTEVFSTSTAPFHARLIRPFVHRMAFELSRSCL